MKVILMFLLCGLFIRSPNVHGQSQCVNPNQRPGTCISIYECESLLSVLSRKPLTQIDRQFVASSECRGGVGKSPHVCCTTDIGYRRVNARESPSTATFLFPTALQPQLRPSERRLSPRQTGQKADLPVPPACGAVAIENKIYGGSDADLFEFPWMVLLEYGRKNGGRSSNCAGSLINQRYVLTAAHCVMGTIVKQIGPLVSIRLGDHDSTREVDCNQFSCASEATRVGIEKAIPHAGYVDASTNKKHDIAIVRMDRDIMFSDSVRPICLPTTVVESEKARAGTELLVAGWGRTLKSAKSAVKQKLVVPLVDQEECRKKFLGRKVDIVETQICAGGQFAQDSCDGDSGGPLMRFRGNVWVLEGIVSFGVKCGLKDWPAVHTRIASYDEWIRSNVFV